MLEENGLSPWEDTSKPLDEKKQYMLQIQRSYETFELERCRYLELRPPSESHLFDSAPMATMG